MKAIQIVEAALFSAGKAVSAQEISENTSIPQQTVERLLKELQALYASRETVLEISPAGKKWAMQVKVEAAEPATKFAQMEIAPKLLKTLALIAYHQPIKQSDLSNMIGAKVYDHIPELKELGLVRTRREGQTKIISVTPRFPEYFGLEAATPHQIREMMAKLVGIKVPTKAKDKGLDQFAPGSGKSLTKTPTAELPAEEL